MASVSWEEFWGWQWSVLILWCWGPWLVGCSPITDHWSQGLHFWGTIWLQGLGTLPGSMNFQLHLPAHFVRVLFSVGNSMKIENDVVGRMMALSFCHFFSFIPSLSYTGAGNIQRNAEASFFKQRYTGCLHYYRGNATLLSRSSSKKIKMIKKKQNNRQTNNNNKKNLLWLLWSILLDLNWGLT